MKRVAPQRATSHYGAKLAINSEFSKISTKKQKIGKQYSEDSHDFNILLK